MLDKAMHASYGSVTLPIFEIKTTMQLAEALKGMGLEEIFQNLDGVFRMPKSKINDVGQTIDFAVDQHGIRASAETVIGAIPLGIIVDPHAFHMSLDRPFLFFVHDYPTNALLFAGVVMDPSAKGH
jgi:serine protease inhibitor